MNRGYLSLVYLLDVAVEAHEEIVDNFLAKPLLFSVQSIFVLLAQLVHVLRVVICLHDMIQLIIIRKIRQLIFQLLCKLPRVDQVILHVVTFHFGGVQLFLELIDFLFHLLGFFILVYLELFYFVPELRQLLFVIILESIDFSLALVILVFEEGVEAKGQQVPQNVKGL